VGGSYCPRQEAATSSISSQRFEFGLENLPRFALRAELYVAAAQVTLLVHTHTHHYITKYMYTMFRFCLLFRNLVYTLSQYMEDLMTL